MRLWSSGHRAARPPARQDDRPPPYVRATLIDSDSLRVPLTTSHRREGPFTDLDSLKEPFTDHPRRSPVSDAPRPKTGSRCTHASSTQPTPAADAPAIEAPAPPAADAPHERGTHTSPTPRYEAPLRFGGACQGIFPALTSTPEPSAQSTFGVPHATNRRDVAARRRADHQLTPTRSATNSANPGNSPGTKSRTTPPRTAPARRTRTVTHPAAQSCQCRTPAGTVSTSPGSHNTACTSRPACRYQTAAPERKTDPQPHPSCAPPARSPRQPRPPTHPPANRSTPDTDPPSHSQSRQRPQSHPRPEATERTQPPPAPTRRQSPQSPQSAAAHAQAGHQARRSTTSSPPPLLEEEQPTRPPNVPPPPDESGDLHSPAADRHTHPCRSPRIVRRSRGTRSASVRSPPRCVGS